MAGALIVGLLLVAVIPEVCPAIAPAPPSCAPDARESAAINWGLIIPAAAVLGIAATYLVPLRLRHRTITIAMIVVAVAGVLAIGATFIASGFILI